MRSRLESKWTFHRIKLMAVNILTEFKAKRGREGDVIELLKRLLPGVGVLAIRNLFG